MVRSSDSVDTQIRASPTTMIFYSTQLELQLFSYEPEPDADHTTNGGQLA